MSGRLVVEGLRAGVGGQEILRGVDLSVSSGEVHAVMGPNGSGKSTLAHVIAGRPGYEVYGGSVSLDGVDLLALPAWQRAQAGLFLAMQYPSEVPGVTLAEMLTESLRAQGRATDDVPALVGAEAERIGMTPALLSRSINVEFSGGEKKRNEVLQLALLAPKVAVLDEIDSGLDIDALRAVARRVEEITNTMAVGILVITHYPRLLRELRPDFVSVLQGGRIVDRGGPELAENLERTGYAAYGGESEKPAPPDGDGAGGLDFLL